MLCFYKSKIQAWIEFRIVSEVVDRRWNNIILNSNYSGVDPELNVSGANGFGGDTGIYPRTRSVAMGLNVILK